MIRWLVGIFAITLTLTACGGGEPAPTPPVDPPPAPANISVSPAVAMPGDTVTVHGTALSNATVHLAGNLVVLDSESDTKLVFHVPSSAPGGPQALHIATEHGSAAADLFVGFDFPSGTMAQLAAKNLPPGTAVRLGRTTYTTNTTTVLHNLSLYGHSAADTRIVLPVLTAGSGSAPPYLALMVDGNHDIAIANLTLELGMFIVGTDVQGSIFSASAAPQDAQSWQAAITQAIPSSGTTVTFQDIEVTQGPGNIVSMFSVGPHPVNGNFFPIGISNNVLLERSNINVSNLWAMGSGVTVNNSSFRAGEIMLAAGGGLLELHDAEIENNANINTPLPTLVNMQTVLYGSSGYEIHRSQVQSVTPIFVVTQPEPSMFMAAPISHISNSVFTFTSENSNNVPEALQFLSPLGMVHIDKSEFVIEGNITFAADRGISRFAVRNSQFTLGNPNFASSSAPPILQFHAEKSGITQQFTGNTVTFHNSGTTDINLNAQSNTIQSQVELASNTITGSGTGPALQMKFAGTSSPTATLQITGNTFHNFFSAVEMESGASDNVQLSAVINNNVFDFDISALGQVAKLTNISPAHAVINARHNVWGTNTNSAVVHSFIDSSTGQPEVFVVDPVTAP